MRGIVLDVVMRPYDRLFVVSIILCSGMETMPWSSVIDDLTMMMPTKRYQINLPTYCFSRLCHRLLDVWASHRRRQSSPKKKDDAKD